MEQLERTFNGAPDMFRTNYHNTVNESVEEYVLDAQLYDSMTADCSSALYECLVNKRCQLDDLDVGSKAEKTYSTTYTASTSFNFFWMHHNFCPEKEPGLCNLREKFGDMNDGFAALCSASHAERNVLLAHYVSKMVKRVEVKQGDISFVTGRTKRGYLNSLMRAMKMYEKEHDLTSVYGDWTWCKSDAYEQTKAALKKKTAKQESAVSPNKLNKAVDL